MAKIYSDAETVQTLASSLISTFHPHLAEAKIRYLWVDKGAVKNGRPVFGKVKKCGDDLKFLLDCDFIITVALDHFNELDGEGRQAALDHLLEHCGGEEDEKTGEMKYAVRSPDVQEFTSILRRHGVWQEGLNDFVTVSKMIETDVATTATTVAMTTQGSGDV
jgi:hypothetical protein